MQREAAELCTEALFARASQSFGRVTGIPVTDHCRQEVATRLDEAADGGRGLPSRQQGEAVIAQAGNGRVWRPVVAADGTRVPTRPEAISR